MEVESTKIEKVIPYARNPRNNASAVSAVAGSIKEFGWQQPIVVDKDMVVIVGHTRLLAAQQLGLEDVPVVIASQLNEAQIKAYRIADNRSGENAEWNLDLLSLELGDLKELDFDLDLTGFDDSFIIVPEQEGLTDEDAVPEVPEIPVTVLGDVWILGNHRLMCGDSTSIDAVEKLMDGQKADMVFTDPPYGDNHAGMTWDKSKGRIASSAKIKNDSDLSYLSEVCSNALLIAKDKCAKMVFFKWSHYAEVEGLFSGFGKPSSCCVWDRDEIAAACFSFNPSHEFCFFWGSLADKYNKSNLRNVWRCKKEKGSKELHPTVKPVEIVADAIDVACPRYGVVVDFFGGSGSTLVACETTGKKANLMELDPKYCDVIINRWQDFTGKKAVHEDGRPFNG